MDARVSSAVKVSIACGFAIFFATLLIGSQQDWLFKMPNPGPGSMPTPTDDGALDIAIFGIGSMLAAMPILAVGGALAIKLSRASINSIKGSINVAILTALLSYVAWMVITLLGSLALAIVHIPNGMGLIMMLLVFLFLGMFTLIAPALMLMGVAWATIAGFVYAVHVLKLN